ncbi:MAG TPA: Imm8 family immunity protein [Candidatus Eisenbacteria bacterium]|nr:Imm8 family immunity protein [Candidatus Eisenbacteria bacterium]
MVYPEVRRIHSRDLDPPNLPDDPKDCEISFHLVVGPKNGDGEEAFDFAVVTPARLARNSAAVWGRGKLILRSFEWGALAEAVAKLLAQCARPTWGEAVAELNKELRWEFDGHKGKDA